MQRLVNGLIKIDLSKIVSAGREQQQHEDDKRTNHHFSSNNKNDEYIKSNLRSCSGNKYSTERGKSHSRQKYTMLNKKGSNMSDKENNPSIYNMAPHNVKNSANYNSIITTNMVDKHNEFESNAMSMNNPSHRRNYSTGNVFAANNSQNIVSQKSQNLGHKKSSQR